MPTEFSTKVISVLKKIPRGKVATYGQIATLAGRPDAVRGVVWILNSSSKTQKLPWHRVLNAKGKISFDPLSSSYVRQRSLLFKEGVEFDEAGEIDFERFRWLRGLKRVSRRPAQKAAAPAVKARAKK